MKYGDVVKSIFSMDDAIFDLKQKEQNMQSDIKNKLQMLVDNKEDAHELGMLLNAFNYVVKEGQVTEKVQSDQHEEHYKAYAYIKGKSIPKILYANEPDELMIRVRTWNQARPEDNKFQSINIGTLNEDNSYGNYRRYEIESGKEITARHLTIPNMTSEKFKETISYLKSHGAKYIPAKKQWYITADMDEKPFEEFLEMKVKANEKEQERTFSGNEEYSLEVCNDFEENKCIVSFNDGRNPIEIHGDQFGINFTQIDMDAAVKLTEDYIRKSTLLDQDSVLSFEKIQPGREIECYVPHINNTGEIDQMTKINAHVDAVDTDKITISNSSDSQYKNEIYRSSAFTKAQSDVITRCIQDKLDQESIFYIANSRLLPGEMDVIQASIKDGFNLQEIRSFAERGYSVANMDLFRIGMQHGVSYETIEKIAINEGLTWEKKRNNLDLEISSAEQQIARTWKQSGFDISREASRKITQINHYTHKKNTVKDIAELYRNQELKESLPKTQLMINDVARECQTLEMARAK